MPLMFAKTVFVLLGLTVTFHTWLAEVPRETRLPGEEPRSIPRREELQMSHHEVKLSKVAVIMLGVKELPKSVAFYRDTLGLQPQGEVPGEFAFFNGGGMMLALSVPHADAKASPHTVGATEVVFAVDDVTANYNALRARGVTFLSEPRNVTGTNWSAVFLDPDGHRLSIFGPKGSS